MTISVSHITAGVTAVFVGYSSAAVLILQAVQTLGGGPAEQSSWLFALGIAMGLSSLTLSWWYKAPVLTGWSTPGVALLITALAGVSMAEAVGIFIFSSFLIVICGLSGIFDRLMNIIPTEVAAALLAGILLQFGLAVLPALREAPFLVGGLVITYFVIKRLAAKWVFAWLILAAISLSMLQGSFDGQHITLSWPALVWVWPEFNINLLIGVGLPLFLITMVSQNIPGLLGLRANGYRIPASPLLTVTGFSGLLLAPLGAFAVNLSAIAASICQSEHVDPEPAKRYKSVLIAGLTYLIAGFMGMAIVGLFMALPGAVTTTLAGLALLTVITNSLTQSFSNPKLREPALLTFLITLSGVSFFDLHSAFWGLLTGCVAHWLGQKGSSY